MPENTCLFCQIVNKTIPATIRWEDENWLAFDDISRQAPEHILIIPKTHYMSLEKVDEIDHDTHSQLLLTARKIAHQVGISDNYKLFMNVGERVQVIHHLHLHLLGGWGKEKPTSVLDQESSGLINS